MNYFGSDGSGGEGAWPILAFDRGNSYFSWSVDRVSGTDRVMLEPEHSEDFRISERGLPNYGAVYRSKGQAGTGLQQYSTDVYYGLRYIMLDTDEKRSTPPTPYESAKYISAYRYQRVRDRSGRLTGLSILVRTLAHLKRNPYFLPETRLGYSGDDTEVMKLFNEVANEAYWNKELDWNQSEFCRFLPVGKYWSQTLVSRDRWSCVMCIFPTSGNRPISDGAYISDPTRTNYTETINKSDNIFKSLYYTTDFAK